MLVKTASLETLLELNEQLKADFSTSFSDLTSQQINWKPHPNAWSIAQCAEHLIKTNDLYMERLEEVLDGKYQPRLLENVPGMTKLASSLLYWGMTTTKKLKTPTAFVPSASAVSPSVLDDFFKQHSKMKLMMQRTIPLQAENKTFTSPASPLFVFKLLDIFRISTLHTQRHYQQALKVKNNPRFSS